MVGIAVLDIIWSTTARGPIRAVDDQVGGMLDACRITGTPLWHLIVWPQMFPTLLSGVRCLAYTLIALVLVPSAGLHLDRLPHVALLFGLTTMALCLVAVALRGLALTIGHRLPLGLLFAAAASLLSAPFYPVEALPPWAESLSILVPTHHWVTAARQLLLEGADLSQVSTSVSWLLGTTVFLGLLAAATLALTTRKLLRTDPTGRD
jgi:ABC-2 type transport system permease protein